jgi:putative membrane protein
MNRLTLSALLFIPLSALAAEAQDTSFYTAAAHGGLEEVEAGRLAQDKSSDPRVKEFAAMMVKDHSTANDELKSIAAQQNVTLPTSPSLKQQAAKTKLEALSGESFDKAYVKDQVSAHRSAVALFKKEIASGHDAAAKTFARKTLPTLRAHLKSIDSLARGMGVRTAAR